MQIWDDTSLWAEGPLGQPHGSWEQRAISAIKGSDYFCLDFRKIWETERYIVVKFMKCSLTGLRTVSVCVCACTCACVCACAWESLGTSSSALQRPEDFISPIFHLIPLRQRPSLNLEPHLWSAWLQCLGPSVGFTGIQGVLGIWTLILILSVLSVHFLATEQSFQLHHLF